MFFRWIKRIICYICYRNGFKNRHGQIYHKIVVEKSEKTFGTGYKIRNMAFLHNCDWMNQTEVTGWRGKKASTNVIGFIRHFSSASVISLCCGMLNGQSAFLQTYKCGHGLNKLLCVLFGFKFHWNSQFDIALYSSAMEMDWGLLIVWKIAVNSYNSKIKRFWKLYCWKLFWAGSNYRSKCYILSKRINRFMYNVYVPIWREDRLSNRYKNQKLFLFAGFCVGKINSEQRALFMRIMIETYTPSVKQRSKR